MLLIRDEGAQSTTGPKSEPSKTTEFTAAGARIVEDLPKIVNASDKKKDGYTITIKRIIRKTAAEFRKGNDKTALFKCPIDACGKELDHLKSLAHV